MAVRDDYAERHAGRRPQPFAQRRRGAVGVLRQQQRLSAALVFDVGLVDAGVGAHEAQPMPDNHNAGSLPHDLRGFIQYELG